MKIGSYELVHPEYLYILMLVPLFILWQVVTYFRHSGHVNVSKLPDFVKLNLWMQLSPSILNLLRLIGFIAIVVALARPRIVDEHVVKQAVKGIDIALSVDVSGSMLAKDLKPNRLEALKKVAEDFVRRRPTDRFALISYSGESFTNVPLTSDKALVINSIKNLEYGLLENGTAIGVGLANAVKRLENSAAESKVIILLTDGKSTGGFIEPLTAARLAKEIDIKVYTIGIGTKGLAEFPVGISQSGEIVYRVRPTDIDEDLLKEIAQTTGGRYFRATDNKKLSKIYAEIDKLEKTEVDETKYFTYKEYFYHLIAIALIALGLEALLKYTLFTSII